MMETGTFGVVALLPLLISLFFFVLTIVFVFKAMAFMNRTTELDRERNAMLKDLLYHLQRNDKD
jgi:hypothetical protein